jgi:hypothetical protein
MKRLILLISALTVLFNYDYAQETDAGDKKKSGFGGPDQVENLLEEDKKPKQSFFELGFMQPYFDFKDNLKEKTGLDLG